MEKRAIMKILIIGAAGMIGNRLARSILRNGFSQTAHDIILFDVITPTLGSDINLITIKTGNIADPMVAKKLIANKPDIIFHLAAIVSGDAEAEFEKGWNINAQGTWHLLEEIRKFHIASDGFYTPKFIYTSSIAIFSGPYPNAVDDDFAPNPETSYGAQKLVGEVLINDYTRKGFVNGVALRFPTIVVRPGIPNKAASSFYSSIIREPLNGNEAILPVSDTLRHWFASPRSAIGFLRHAAILDLTKLGKRRALNLPGVSCSIADQIMSLEALAGTKISKLIKRQADPVIESIVTRWPQSFIPERATSLGFIADDSFTQIIQNYIDEEIEPGLLNSQ